MRLSCFSIVLFARFLTILLSLHLLTLLVIGWTFIHVSCVCVWMGGGWVGGSLDGSISNSSPFKQWICMIQMSNLEFFPWGTFGLVQIAMAVVGPLTIEGRGGTLGV